MLLHHTLDQVADKKRAWNGDVCFFYLWSFLDDLEHQLQNMSRWKFIYIDTSLSQTGLQVHQTSLWRVFKSLMRLPYTSVMMDVLMDCQLDCQAMPSIVVFRCGCRMVVAKLACFGLSDVQRWSYSWKIGWVGSCVPKGNLPLLQYFLDLWWFMIWQCIYQHCVFLVISN